MFRAQSDESLTLSFHIFPVDTVYEQVFLNLQCVGLASSIPFIMYYLYCVTSTKDSKAKASCASSCAESLGNLAAVLIYMKKHALFLLIVAYF